MMREFAAPVSRWMLDALDPQPGQRILELAAGVGETGLMAAEAVGPDGSVLISDQAEGMLDAARERATELGVQNVEFRQLNAEWIDLPAASVDGVLCRWGYMLMVDPQAALRETRRVLAPGGRVALAVWDDVGANPWFALPGRELVSRGLITPPDPDAKAPGPFALSDRSALTELLLSSGFADVRVETVDLTRSHPDFSEFWESTLDFSLVLHDAVMSRPAEEVEEVRSSLAQSLAPFTTEDGSISLPGRTLAAVASA